MDEPKQPPVVAEARSSLAYLCFKLGEWNKGQDYLESALSALKDLQFDPSVSLLCDSWHDNITTILCLLNQTLTAVENLATAFMETGQHEESVRLLKNIIEEKQGCQQQHTALAIPLAKLSVAYYYNGDWEKSAEVAKESLQQDMIPPWDGMLLEL